MKPKRVDVHIEELVVNGVEGIDAADAPHLSGSVKRELERLITERGVPSQLRREGQTARIDGGELPVTGSGEATSLGAHIARKVYGGSNG